METELLPCPFCNQPPRVPYKDTVSCATRGCGIWDFPLQTREWQARATRPQPATKPDAAEALGALDRTVLRAKAFGQKESNDPILYAEWIDKDAETIRTALQSTHKPPYIADENGNIRPALQNQGAQWMPIETAPKDADNFLIANFANKPSFISFAWWPYDAKNKNYKWLNYTGGNTVGVHNLTHWMSLPAAPTPNAGDQP